MGAQACGMSLPVFVQYSIIACSASGLNSRRRCQRIVINLLMYAVRLALSYLVYERMSFTPAVLMVLMFHLRCSSLYVSSSALRTSSFSGGESSGHFGNLLRSLSSPADGAWPTGKLYIDQRMHAFFNSAAISSSSTTLLPSAPSVVTIPVSLAMICLPPLCADDPVHAVSSSFHPFCLPGFGVFHFLCGSVV